MPDENGNRKILVISDTHFGRRENFSNWKLYQAFTQAAKEADHVVLGGDIAELFVRGDVKDIVREGLQLVEKIVTDNPETNFHFTLGNHEEVGAFVKGMEWMQEKYDNLEFDRMAVRIGKALFTHGHHFTYKMFEHTDDRPIMTLKERQTFEDKRERGEYQDTALRKLTFRERLGRELKSQFKPGSALHDLGKQMATPYYGTPTPEAEVVARTVHKNLAKWVRSGNAHYTENRERKQLTSLDEISNVIYGHTHTGMLAYEYQGLTFHNSGASVMTFGTSGIQALGFEMDKEGNVVSVQPALGAHSKGR